MGKKKLIMIVVACMVCLAANAQFERGKVYVGASLSGLDMSYSGATEGKFGIQLKGGYIVTDDLLVLGNVAWQKQSEQPAHLEAGAGARYYIVQNGLYLGLGGKYVHDGTGYNDFMPGVQIGYAFFLSKTVTIEPEVYYDQSLKNHGDYSAVGFRLGIGVYL